MESKKKIMFFSGSMKRGGAERVISVIANELIDKGYEVHICTLLFRSVDYNLNRGIILHFLCRENVSRIKNFPFWFSNIRKIVRDVNPDTIISFAARINVIVMMACIGLNKKIIVSERNDPKHDGRGFYTNILTSYFYPKASKVVFQTRRVQSYFNKKIQNNSTIICNPISVETTIHDTNPNKIVSVGRLTEQKNPLMLLEAFKEVHGDFKETHLYFYGEGNLKESLVKFSKDNNIEKFVHFEGNVPNVHECIADAGIFVLSSDYEGLSNALLEAMMMGLPCISTNCAGSDEYIEDEKNGLLIEIGNKKQLVESIKKLLEHPKSAKELGRMAKKSSYKYEKGKIISEWEELI